MRINKRLIDIISAEIVKNLLKEKAIEVKDYQMLEERINSLITNDLSEEDRLDEEVRKIMEQHSDVIRGSNVEYHEMFKTIKKKLMKERKIVF
jgi:hypothetical protein